MFWSHIATGQKLLCRCIISWSVVLPRFRQGRKQCPALLCRKLPWARQSYYCCKQIALEALPLWGAEGTLLAAAAPLLHLLLSWVSGRQAEAHGGPCVPARGNKHSSDPPRLLSATFTRGGGIIYAQSFVDFFFFLLMNQSLRKNNAFV